MAESGMTNNPTPPAGDEIVERQIEAGAKVLASSPCILSLGDNAKDLSYHEWMGTSRAVLEAAGLLKGAEGSGGAGEHLDIAKLLEVVRKTADEPAPERSSIKDWHDGWNQFAKIMVIILECELKRSEPPAPAQDVVERARQIANSLGIRGSQYELIDALASAGLLPVQDGGWRTIESAPLGKMVWLWAPAWRHAFPGQCNGNYGACYIDTCEPIAKGWQGHATHWMPLPAPPVQGGRVKEESL